MAEGTNPNQEGQDTEQPMSGPIPKLPQNEANNIKGVIAVMSGKGGVGKSSVAALLAAGLSRAGHRVGVLDADVTGPSIPKLFGISGRPGKTEKGLLPVESEKGVKVMSLNLLLPNEDDPVIWRGPLIAGAVRQFWTDVVWGDLDYLVVDLPPGTGDSPLTVLQSLPVDGIVIVSSPQELAVMVVKKAIKMAQSMGVPIVGLVENMSYLTCPHCGERLEIFGASKAQQVSEETGLPVLATIPIDPQLAELGDAGQIEDYTATPVDEMVEGVRRSK